MVKPPKIRHSKSRRDPVTIDLDPADVKRETDAAATESAASFGGEEPVQPNAADEALAGESPTGFATAEMPAAKEASGDGAATAETSRYGRNATESSGSIGEPRRPSGMPALIGGVTGAILALAGAAGLQWAGVLPAPRGETAAVDSASLDVLRSEIEALKQQPAASDGAADPALAQSLGESNSRIDSLASAVEQLRADFASQPAQTDAGADPAALQAMETPLSQIEATAGAATDTGAAVQDLTSQITELGASLRSAVEATAAQTARLDAIEQRIAAMDERVEAQAAEPGMALAVAATSLKSAIDRGAPFMMELETYAAIAPDVPQIAALRDLAASGVPTRAEINAETADAAARMITASTPVDERAGFVERLYSSARSLVEVRPVGVVEGDSAGAIVARMEVALGQGDFEKAVAEFETLPPPAQAAGEDFIAKVRARSAADRLVAEALAGALKASEG